MTEPEGRPDPHAVPSASIDLVVAGAHLRGQPLAHQLTDRGARFVEATTTAAAYRFYALATDPPKPGLVRSAGGGRGIAVEVWSLAPAAFGDFVAAVPPPLAIGSVELADGSWRPGFCCTPDALDGAVEITEWGGWLAYLADRST